MFEEEEQNSDYKNELIRSLNNIAELIDHPGRFKSSYNLLINTEHGPIGAMIKQSQNFEFSGKRTVKAEIKEAVLKNIDYVKLSKELASKIKNKQPPTTIKYKELPDLDQEAIGEFDTGIFVNIWDSLPESSEGMPLYNKNKSAAKGFLKYYLSRFSSFENNLCKRRDASIKIMNDNLPHIVAEHYKAAHAIIGGSPPPESIKVMGVGVKFHKKQKDFIECAVKSIINGLN